MNGLRRNDAEAATNAGIKKMPLVSIVILNWNGKDWLRQFLPFVLASSYINKRVIVADNNSTDDSVLFLQQNFPGVEILINAQNEGFAKGYNSALKQVKSDYFILLNSDVEVTAGWIEPVIELMEGDPLIAACQPKILSYHQRTHFEYAGACGGWIDNFGYPFSRGRVFDDTEKDNGQYDDAETCFWATGAALFVKADLYHAAGGLDEYFFAHQEEIDLCWRLQLAGYKIYVQPASVVYHVGGGTLAKGNDLKTFLNFRNNLIMCAKNLPLAEAVWKIPVRLMLDGVAAWKEIFGGNAGYFFSVCKSHVMFVKWLVFDQRKSVFPASKKGKLNGLYKSSIVWQYFIKKKKAFSEIVKDK
ncbi:MAG: glycosyltransferase family 2 protein [Ferruginibacter sp.]